MSTPFLAVRDLVKHYPGVRAVDGISGVLAAGDVIGLVGKNGAGKSTLIKMLAGVVQPDAGEILIDGEPVRLGSAREATGHGLAFVHQELSDVPNLSVAENVELGLGYPRRLGVFVDRRRLYEKTQELLERLGEPDIDPATPVGSLSVAHQRLVMIARGVAADARLLVLDEPSASLTIAEVENLHRLVRSLQRDGVSVLYVTHRLDEIFALTDRVVVMRDGRVVDDRPTSQLDDVTLIAEITGDEPREAGKRRPRAADAQSRREEVLRAEGLTVPGVVEDVSFSLHAGEILGVAGLVGAGRTELARLLFGADRPASGRVLLHGHEVRIHSPREALRHGIVLLPEDRRNHGSILDFSIRRNITLPTLPRFRGRRRLPMPDQKRERTAAQRLMRDLAVAAASDDQPVRLLSGGNQQKVVLAKWLERGADVFIFDEPTHGIDVGAKDEIYRLMEHLAARGKAVIFISSEFSELVAICPRLVVLREGRIVGELEGEAIQEGAVVGLCYASGDHVLSPQP